MQNQSLIKPFILLLLLAFAEMNGQWNPAQKFIGAPRDDGATFTIGNSAYCGTGLTPWFATTNDFFAFNLDTRQWQTISTLPSGEERQYASAFSNNMAGFIFGGTNNNLFYNNLFSYNPNTNIWTQKDSLPDKGRSGAASFVLNDTAYIIGGKTSAKSAINQVWAYATQHNTWHKKNNMPFNLWCASAAVLNGKGYVIFGIDKDHTFKNLLLEYTPQIDLWTVVDTFPNIGRSHASLQTMGNQLLVFGGVDSVNHFYNDFWKYNNLQKNWTKLDHLPGLGRRGGMAFNNGNTFFYTTGLDSNGNRLQETWKIEYPTHLLNFDHNEQIQIFPNPNNGLLYISGKEVIDNLKIIDGQGKVLCQFKNVQPQSPVDISKIKAGFYLVELKLKKQSTFIKLIKE